MVYDIVIGNIPVTYDTPPIAPAQLKSFVEHNGFKCKIVDWNRHIRSTLDEKHALFNSQTSNQIFMSGKLIDNNVRTIMMEWIHELKGIESRFIGISCFGLEKNKMILFELLKLIKEQIPERPIVIGGTGIPLDGIGIEAKEMGLVDYYVIGEGEYPLLNILKGTPDMPGINGNPSERIKNLDILPPPDYSDLDIYKYPREHLFIENSRGCPMNCAFCYKPLQRFIYRSGKVAANQILYLYTKHRKTSFRFSDSLINGNLKQLREFCNELILLNLENIKLFSFFYVMKYTSMPAEYYALMKRAGFDILSIGVESGSEKVRRKMKKRFSNSDLNFAIKNCVKNKINLHFLFMVGYPPENEDDFKETLDFIKRYSYINKHIKVLVSMGNPYIISLQKGSMEDVYYNDPDIETDDCGNWVSGDNNYLVRADRWFRLREVVKEYGYHIFDRSINTIKTKVKEYEKCKS